jgi:hypothetical protein
MSDLQFTKLDRRLGKRRRTQTRVQAYGGKDRTPVAFSWRRNSPACTRTAPRVQDTDAFRRHRFDVTLHCAQALDVPLH